MKRIHVYIGVLAVLILAGCFEIAGVLLATDWGGRCQPSDPGHTRAYHCSSKVGDRCMLCCSRSCRGCFHVGNDVVCP